MKTYFIQDTRQYVGNSLLFWRNEGKGYTTDLSEAWEVDEQKARQIERNRDTDKAIPADLARAAVVQKVDAQRLPVIQRLTEAHPGHTEEAVQ